MVNLEVFKLKYIYSIKVNRNMWYNTHQYLDTSGLERLVHHLVLRFLPFQQYIKIPENLVRLACLKESSNPICSKDKSIFSQISCKYLIKGGNPILYKCPNFWLTEGSKDMIRTVLSARPTAKNRDRCSPDGTLAKAMQMTSADISFLSVYSLSCPD